MNDSEKMAVVVVMVLLVLFLLGFGPIFTIWSLNAVFGLEIPITFKTWCGAVWLMTILHGIRLNMKNSNDGDT